LLNRYLATLQYWTALNDVCRMNPEKSLVSRILDLDLYPLELRIWISESRNELISCQQKIGHQVEQLTALCYSLLLRSVSQIPDNVLIYTSLFVAAETCFKQPFPNNRRLCCACLTEYFRRPDVISQYDLFMPGPITTSGNHFSFIQ
jgi:hypothetical protein